MSEILLTRQKRKGFLHRIVTEDEKWIFSIIPNEGNPLATQENHPHRHQSGIFMARK